MPTLLAYQTGLHRRSSHRQETRMPPDLPKPIAAYFSADRADSEAVACLEGNQIALLEIVP
jgi:hypothetical protein